MNDISLSDDDNFAARDDLYENLSRAHALICVAMHARDFSEFSEKIIHNYLWAVEQQICAALESYQKAFPDS